MLNTFVYHNNIEPRGHTSDLLYPQAFLLYSLGTGTVVDIPRTIFYSMLRIYGETRKLTLLFGAMICKLMVEVSCQVYTYEMPVSRRQKIDDRTKGMSDTHVRGRLQGEPVQVQEDDEESIANRLLAVEHAVYDQSVQIEQLEEWMTTGFTDICNHSTDQYNRLSNQLTDMFNQLRHQ